MSENSAGWAAGRDEVPAAPVGYYARFDMLYCDHGRCRVNTFERGSNGLCPGCGSDGIPVPTRRRG